MENTNEIMDMATEVAENVEVEEVIEHSGNGLKIAGAIGIGAICGVLGYKFVFKPMVRKIRAMMEARNNEENDTNGNAVDTPDKDVPNVSE